MYNTENQKTTGAFSGARSLIDPCIEARRSGDLMELPWEKRRKLVSNGGIRDDLSRLRRFVRGLRGGRGGESGEPEGRWKYLQVAGA